MMMSLAAALALARSCAPSVAPETLLSVVQVESGFDPLAIGINGPRRVSIGATTASDAASKASNLIAKGQNLDLGLAQINSRNLARLGLSVEQAFDPCANLSAAARILQLGYARASAATTGEQLALRTALSLYNTGQTDRGFANGYVAKVVRASSQIVPALAAAPVGELARTRASAPAVPSWDVFRQAGRTQVSFVISVYPTSGDKP